jgi:hypothetical protein
MISPIAADQAYALVAFNRQVGVAQNDLIAEFESDLIEAQK